MNQGEIILPMIKVCKFGGTAISSGDSIRRVKKIIETDPERRYIVVSAPGKRFKDDIKVTDLLYDTYQTLLETGKCGSAFEEVKARCRTIVQELDLAIDIEKLLVDTEKEIVYQRERDFTASRGEYLAGKIVASFLNVPFIDSCDIIRFSRGKLDNEPTYALTSEALQDKERAVIAGFYGADKKGNIVTFSRGGSDITGAIVARAINANLYEKWTDVSGFLACDPQIVDNPLSIKHLSYAQLRSLAYAGADVLHGDSIFPVREVGIPIKIKNYLRPEDYGTDIMPEIEWPSRESKALGIAGKKDLLVIRIRNHQINNDPVQIKQIFSIFEKFNFTFEHVFCGIATISIVVKTEKWKTPVKAQILDEIAIAVCPEEIVVYDEVSVVALIGHNMDSRENISRLLVATANADDDLDMLDHAVSKTTVMLVMRNGDYNRIIKAIYKEFF